MATNLYDPLSPLHSPDEHSKWQPINSLNPIRPMFFIPRLENQPQNPILDALKLEQTQTTTKSALNLALPNANGHAFEYSKSNPLRINTDISDRNVDDIWLAAASGSQTDGVREWDPGSGRLLTRAQSKLKTWDGLRSTYSHDIEQGDLISEHDPALFAAAQEL